MEHGSARRPGPLPLRAILLFLAVVIALRVASAWPAGDSEQRTATVVPAPL